jgi:hypothetical protein
MQLVVHAVAQAQHGTEFDRACADLLIIGIYYLLRPGEHTHTSNSDDNHPFRLQDVSFVAHNATHNAATASTTSLQAATLVHLNFTTQKNGETNEALTHGDTTDPLLSPLKAVRRRVQHLRQARAPPNSPLYMVHTQSAILQVTSNHLTAMLRRSVRAIGKDLGLEERDISARALRAGGAMALLRANVDPLLVRMMGRWKSWTMIQYLHRSATNTTDLAARMLQHGNFIIPQHAFLPADVQHLITPALA